jgi:lactose/L-arabinose transport system substrate-binding protein
MALKYLLGRKEVFMKKICSITLAAAMVLSVFSGCSTGTSSASSSAAPSSKAESAASTAGTTKQKVVNVWAWDVEYNIPVMKEAARRYEAKHPDVKINVTEYAYDDITQKINTILSSGVNDGLPEIMLSEDANVQKYITSYPGAFRDMKKDVDFSKFAGYKVKVLTSKDGVYGVPFDIGTEGFFYREDYLKKAGYTAADLTDITWDKYIEIGKKVKQVTGKSMLTLDPSSMTIMRDFMQSSGTWYFTPDGKINIANNPAINEGVRIYKNLLSSGIVKLTSGWGEMASALNKGDVASIVTGCWIVPTITAEKSQSGLWRVTRMPRLNISGGTNYGNRGGSNWLVLKNAPNSDVAADFLNEIFAKDVDFYDTILTKIGAIGAYQPANGSETYKKPVAFFGNEPIWANFAEWAQKVPPISVGVYSDEADSFMATGVGDVVKNNTDIHKMLLSVEDQLKSQIQ